ncbi:MAG: hypothetical protein DPW11_01940 [bacterium]|nr:hypothetical protein [Candidatus Microgenomates bacterium CPR3]MCQ3944519.1 hypothetical protein [bacterium]RIK51081.1 MAG: hypothetical protein DCC61_03805 [Candidatus Microgenomates bacterium]
MVNRGVAFGWFSGLPFWVGILSIILLVVVAVKTRELIARVGLGLMIIGGIMNTYQRVTMGVVVDNLPMFGLGYNNWADYLIFFGVLVYGYGYFRTTRKLRESAGR